MGGARGRLQAGWLLLCKVPPTIEVPHYGQLFESVLRYRLWKVLGPLKHVSSSVLVYTKIDTLLYSIAFMLIYILHPLTGMTKWFSTNSSFSPSPNRHLTCGFAPGA